MQAGIIGLGLIGGSLGLALRETKMFKSIAGLDTNELHAQQALSLGLVDEILELQEIKECDIIFLATPVEGIIETLNHISPLSAHTTLVDLGSTKQRILESVPKEIQKNFVPAHPMCGIENSGPKAAFKELFNGSLMILFDCQESGDFQKAFAKEVFLALGMKILKMDIFDHDHHAAYISHLPHIISFALANVVLRQEDPKSILALAAGGFKGMVRIAKSSPVMWSEVAKQNQENLLESIEAFQKEMQQSKEWIKQEDWHSLYEWMENANHLHDIF
ncbi:prephenate dehydrogenase [Helicobacter monodelphidis]|uniref:prephenate dehydrogenase n=1 Tax=Helicobacter sp. 15-1451 TaxID=2004995 RepID=UPI000DCCFFB2|nr:prephenate dehydrogenase [Helicobacter sp. 15-1451]RAX58917.1 prephenate dehydrogenase [Helicobacter sp. 15-1451]